MTELAILLPLLAFVVLAAGTAIVLRRAGRIVARTREVDGFRSAVRDLTARVDTSLEGATDRIDAVRRGRSDADTIGDTLQAAMDAVARYLVEARALAGPPAARQIRDGIVGELERAGRALEMVEHGTAILVRVRRRGREVEAQTAMKRGYLNLLHAREAIDRLATDAQGLTPSTEPTVSAGSVGARGSRS